MGQEFGQFIEWNYKKQLDWNILKHDMHKKLQNYVKELNKFYLTQSPLWENDDSWDGFKWIAHDDCDQNVIVFRRIDDKENELIFVCNFSPLLREKYRIGVPYNTCYSEVFNSDKSEFGGFGNENSGVLQCDSDEPMHGLSQSIEIIIPPLSVIMFSPDMQERKQREAKNKANIKRKVV